MPWIGPTVAAGAGLIGNFMSQQGAQQTNAQSMAMMMQNEQWQERMSDTAMQRRVEDLKAAGLNPMLAVNTPGAAMPGFQQPTLQNPNQSFAGLGDQVSNALQTSNVLKQGDLIDSQAQQASTQATANAATARKANADAAISEAQGPYAAATASATRDNLENMGKQILAQARKLDSDYDVNEQNVQNLLQQKDFAARIQPFQQQLATYQALAAKYGLSEAKLASDLWSSPTGKAIFTAQQSAKAAGPIGAAVSSAAPLAQAASDYLGKVTQRLFPKATPVAGGIFNVDPGTRGTSGSF